MQVCIVHVAKPLGFLAFRARTGLPRAFSLCFHSFSFSSLSFVALQLKHALCMVWAPTIKSCIIRSNAAAGRPTRAKLARGQERPCRAVVGVAELLTGSRSRSAFECSPVGTIFMPSLVSVSRRLESALCGPERRTSPKTCCDCCRGCCGCESWWDVTIPARLGSAWHGSAAPGSGQLSHCHVVTKVLCDSVGAPSFS